MSTARRWSSASQLQRIPFGSCRTMWLSGSKYWILFYLIGDWWPGCILDLISYLSYLIAMIAVTKLPGCILEPSPPGGIWALLSPPPPPAPSHWTRWSEFGGDGCSWSPNPTDFYFWYSFVVDDQHRNTNMNDKDHLVGQLTSATVVTVQHWFQKIQKKIILKTQPQMNVAPWCYKWTDGMGLG